MGIFLVVTSKRDQDKDFCLDGKSIDLRNRSVVFGTSKAALRTSIDWPDRTDSWRVLLLSPEYMRANYQADVMPILGHIDGVFIHPNGELPIKRHAIESLSKALPDHCSERDILEHKTVGFSIGGAYSEYRVEILSKMWDFLLSGGQCEQYPAVAQGLLDLGIKHQELSRRAKVEPAILLCMLLQGACSDYVNPATRAEWRREIEQRLSRDDLWMLGDDVLGPTAKRLVDWVAENAEELPEGGIPKEATNLLRDLRRFVESLGPAV